MPVNDEEYYNTLIDWLWEPMTTSGLIRLMLWAMKSLNQ
jgi:hypothetical protein